MEPTETTTPTPPQAIVPLETVAPQAFSANPPQIPLTQAKEQQNVPVQLPPQIIIEEVKGGYSWTRHILLVVLILLAVIIICSLIYLNGKSIYQYGL